MQDINKDPLVIELEINLESTPEIYKYLKLEKQLYLKLLATSLYNRKENNKLIPLLLQRKDDTILLPSFDEELKIGDKILIACDEEALNDMEYICENIYEFHYALTGEEKKTILKGMR